VAIDELTPEQIARRRAALDQVRKYGDPVLRERRLAALHLLRGRVLRRGHGGILRVKNR